MALIFHQCSEAFENNEIMRCGKIFNISSRPAYTGVKWVCRHLRNFFLL